MRAVIKFTKGDEVKFVSHLDMLRLFQRAFRRASLPLAFSQGFNPHPLMSFATALSVGVTSAGEYLDVILTEELPTERIKNEVNAMLPVGVEIVEVCDASGSKASLTSAMRSAEYDIKITFPNPIEEGELRRNADELLSGEIIVQKKTKGGIKPTDIRPMVKELAVIGAEGCTARLHMRGVLTAEGGLNPELLLGELYKKLGTEGVSAVHRTEIEMDMKALLGP